MSLLSPHKRKVPVLRWLITSQKIYFPWTLPPAGASIPLWDPSFRLFLKGKVTYFKLGKIKIFTPLI